MLYAKRASQAEVEDEDDSTKMPDLQVSFEIRRLC